MFGPLTANLTLRVNSTDRVNGVLLIESHNLHFLFFFVCVLQLSDFCAVAFQIHPNHGVHFAGFVVGFFVTIVLLSLGFLAVTLTGSRTRLNLLQQKV